MGVLGGGVCVGVVWACVGLTGCWLCVVQVVIDFFNNRLDSIKGDAAAAPEGQACWNVNRVLELVQTFAQVQHVLGAACAGGSRQPGQAGTQCYAHKACTNQHTQAGPAQAVAPCLQVSA